MIAFQYAVMLAAPRDVLTRFPLLRGFVHAMEWVGDLVVPFAKEINTIRYLGHAGQYPELSQLLASLMIAMLPLYLYCCYRWLSFDRQRNYRHFVLSPYSREVVKSNMAFINDGLSAEEQKKQGISTQAPPGKKRSLIVIFIWSLLLFILPLAASLMIFGLGHTENHDAGVGAFLWMKVALLHVGYGGVSVSFSRCWECRRLFFLAP
jgi:hypothetical protein